MPKRLTKGKAKALLCLGGPLLLLLGSEVEQVGIGVEILLKVISHKYQEKMILNHGFDLFTLEPFNPSFSASIHP